MWRTGKRGEEVKVRQRWEKAAGLLASGRGYRKKARCFLGAGWAPKLIIALSPLKGYTFLDVSHYPTFSALWGK